MNRFALWAVLILVTSSLSAIAANATMIVNRGLPIIHLNDIAGASRSNVCWAETDLQLFEGDTFSVPSGGVWRVNTIRLWFVGYGANNNTNLTDDTFLGDAYGDLSLYVGPVGSPLKRVSVASFIPGSDSTSNPNVVATRVLYNGGVGTELDYQSGNYFTLVQLDFNNLNLDFAGGTQVQFGMHTQGDYAFSHASNAALSGSPQDQADGLFRVFKIDTDPTTATFLNTLDSSGGDWDKSSDINVQVEAHRLPYSYQCGFSMHSKAGEISCQTRGEVCIEALPHDGSCSSPNSLQIRCDNGFRFSDHSATQSLVDETLKLFGDSGSTDANLQIFNFEDRPGEYDASLLVNSNSFFLQIFGSCKLDQHPAMANDVSRPGQNPGNSSGSGPVSRRPSPRPR